MDKSDLIRLLNEVAAGKIEVETAGKQLFDLPYETLDYACLDHHRSLRKGFPCIDLKMPDGHWDQLCMWHLGRCLFNGFNGN